MINKHSWIKNQLQGLYDLEWKLSTAFGTYNFIMQSNPSAMAGGNGSGEWCNSNPMKDIKDFQKQFKPTIDITPKFPTPTFPINIPIKKRLGDL